ncbi:MAG TPA: AraC family transcriptional regulator [Dermatophilaceae bacterium]
MAGPMSGRYAVGPVVRARALRGVPGLVTRHGGDAPAYFARFGLPLAPAEDTTVPVADMNLLLDTAATELECPAFGLLLAEAEDETILGPLAVALSACATVAEAADCASRFLHVHCPAMTTTVRWDPTEPGTVVIGYDIVVPGAPHPTQAMELGVAMTHRILVALVGQEYGLRAVDLSHRPQSEPQRYRDFFGVDVRFRRPKSALHIARETLLAPLPSRNEQVRRIAMDYLSRHHPPPVASVAEQVRATVVEVLGVAPATLTHAARLLNVHPRTLQRQLAADGTTFEQILDTVRRDTARRLLSGSDPPLAEVASLVGLADQATLTRAVRRWFGQTPSRFRRRGAT